LAAGTERVRLPGWCRGRVGAHCTWVAEQRSTPAEEAVVRAALESRCEGADRASSRPRMPVEYRPERELSMASTKLGPCLSMDPAWDAILKEPGEVGRCRRALAACCRRAQMAATVVEDARWGFCPCNWDLGATQEEAVAQAREAVAWAQEVEAAGEERRRRPEDGPPCEFGWCRRVAAGSGPRQKWGVGASWG
jgi:hypothetical protein